MADSNNTNTEYEYLVVPDINPNPWDLENRLKNGWSIDRATSIQSAVHYVLSRAVEEAVVPDTPKPVETAAITDIDDGPIDLSQIPF